MLAKMLAYNKALTRPLRYPTYAKKPELNFSMQFVYHQWAHYGICY